MIVYFKMTYNTRLPCFIAEIVSTLFYKLNSDPPYPPIITTHHRIFSGTDFCEQLAHTEKAIDRFNSLHAMRLYWRTGGTVPFISNLDNRLI